MTALARALLVLALTATTACGGATHQTTARANTAGTVQATEARGQAAGPAAESPSSTMTATDDPRTATASEAPSQTSQPAPTAGTTPPSPAAAHDDPSVYAAPAGHYVYDLAGTIQTEDVTGTSEQPVPPTSTDDIRIADEPAAMRMIVVTRDEGQDSSQETVVAITENEARLVRLSRRPDTGVGISVNPEPPALLARLPYQVGDQWEIAWNDPTTGISGVGTGTVEHRETLTSPAGSFDTVVVTVVQRLRGTISGTLTVTSWIEPATGVQPRQHIVTDLRDATGASRSDTTRTLRAIPS